MLAFRGKVAVSGYDSPLYNEMLSGWGRAERKIANHSGQTKTKSTKTEVLWLNY